MRLFKAVVFLVLCAVPFLVSGAEEEWEMIDPFPQGDEELAVQTIEPGANKVLIIAACTKVVAVIANFHQVPASWDKYVKPHDQLIWENQTQSYYKKLVNQLYIDLMPAMDAVQLEKIGIGRCS